MPATGVVVGAGNRESGVDRVSGSVGLIAVGRSYRSCAGEHQVGGVGRVLSAHREIIRGAAVNEDRPMKLTIQQNARHGGTARPHLRAALARR
jgi:hypothetical protein